MNAGMTTAYQVLPRWGTPPPAMSDGGWGVVKVGYPPHRGTPRPGPTGGWGGTSGGILPSWGTPPSGPGLGTPPPQVWTDRRTDTSQNITFPSYYVRGR